MRFSRICQALWANILVILGLLLAYTVFIILGATVGSEARPPRPEAPPVDVVFVFDTTGSMQDKIDALLRISSRFGQILEDNGSDYQIALISFGAVNEPTPVVRDTFAPSHDMAGFQRFLQGMRAVGGGDEDQPTAMKYALANLTYRPNARKQLILITDEELLGGSAQAAKDWDGITGELAAKGFTCYAVCIPIEPYQALATKTGGAFYDINSHRDFTDILVQIANDITGNLVK